jgi:hypothetical protein
VITELGGPVFEFTHDLIGDLFSAKNAGVTVCGRRLVRKDFSEARILEQQS